MGHRVSTPKTTTIIAAAFVVNVSICCNGFVFSADPSKLSTLPGRHLAATSSTSLVENAELSSYVVLKARGKVLPERNSEIFSAGRSKRVKLLRKRRERNTKLSEKSQKTMSELNDERGETFIGLLPSIVTEPPSPNQTKKVRRVSLFEDNPELVPNPNSFTAEELRQWACATDVHTLRLMFGTNRNKFWGDLDNETTRRLYHYLLPRALISLYQKGLTPHELAPLAYEARCAAKQYARERCNMYGRIFSIVYDGIRHLKKYGSWSSKGLSWDELWLKYEEQVIQEIWDAWRDSQGPSPATYSDMEITSRICLKILEKSCTTNTSVDKLFLKNGDSKNHDGNNGDAVINTSQELLEMASKFEQEVHELLSRSRRITSREIFFLRLLVTSKRKLLMLQQQYILNANRRSRRLLMARRKARN